MSETGENPMDQNPGQAFKEHGEFRPLEEYSIGFGNEIQFDNDETLRGVIVDLGKGPDFTLAIIQKTSESKDMISPVSISNHGVEEKFHTQGTWTPENIKQAIEEYYVEQRRPFLMTENDSPEVQISKRKRLEGLNKIKAGQLAKVDVWAEKFVGEQAISNSRKITVDDIRAGIKKRQTF